MNEEYSTMDIVQASTLLSLNFSLKKLDGPFKVGERDVIKFVFPKDDKITEVVSQFENDRISIEPKRFMYSYRTLKRRMFEYTSRKENYE